MTELIASALAALLARILPATGRRRRTTTPPAPATRQQGASQRAKPTHRHVPHTEAPPFHARHLNEPRTGTADDPAAIVPWYVVLAGSGAWLDIWQAQRRAIPEPRVPARASREGVPLPRTGRLAAAG